MNGHPLGTAAAFLVYSTVIAILFILIIIILNKMIIGKDKSIFDYIDGQDGRPSTSKFQFFVFTFAFVFSFVLLHTYFWFLTGGFRLIDSIPQNVLVAMGFSVVTLVGAKAITVSQISTGRIDKPSATDGGAWASLVSDDAGNLDFSKLQVLIWTLIAVIVFFIDTYKIAAYVNQHGKADFLNHYNPDAKDAFALLPNINPALMILMGLGQGAYLGGKLVLAPIPRLSGIIRTPPVAPATDLTIAIRGGDFGDAQAGSQVLMDNMPLPATAKITTWNKNTISFNPGPNHPNGQKFTTGQMVQIGVMVNGFASSNTLPLTF